jgi:DNA-binding NtrC family response regulator
MLNRVARRLDDIHTFMATNGTLLCINRDPAQLSLLQENGYELVTAANGHDALRLFMSRAVDAVVLDYELGFLKDKIVAAEIKKLNPRVPIVMLADDVELPHGALKAVDALLIPSDGPNLLWATIHYMLKAELDQRREKPRGQTPAHPYRPKRSREGRTVHSAQYSPSSN